MWYNTMEFVGDILNFDEFVAKESDFLKKVNDIFISDRQIEILNKYGIDVNNYKNINELIYYIEEVLNNSDELEDLEWVSERLTEYNYYANTNK